MVANNRITNSNLYFYANNSPVNGIDLDGKATWLTKKLSELFSNGIKTCKKAVTNTASKGKSFFNKAKNKFVRAGKKIVNDIKKAGGNILNAVINSISLELSTGYGINIPITSAGNNIGIHTDYTETAKKGKVEVSKTTSLELFFITVAGKSGDLCEINNEKCEYLPHYESGWSISFPNGVEISDSGIFIGQSFGIHIGMGGNLKAGAMFYWNDILK